MVLGLHPDSAAALYSFDTDAQCAADLVTWLAGGLAFVALLEGHGGSDWRFWAAIGLLPIGLLIKEEALSGAACVLFLIVFSFRRPAAVREQTLKAAGALLVLRRRDCRAPSEQHVAVRANVDERPSTDCPHG